MILTIHYRNGNTIRKSVYYTLTEDGNLYFTEKSNPHPMFEIRTVVPLNNIERFEVETEQEGTK